MQTQDLLWGRSTKNSVTYAATMPWFLTYHVHKTWTGGHEVTVTEQWTGRKDGCVGRRPENKPQEYILFNLILTSVL